MIIRSQDKKTITTDLDLKIMDRDGISVKYKICSSKEGCIGYYSTEEKAIKVLDMIQEAYTQYATIENGFGNIQGAFNLPKCFQMPQDSEV